MGLEVRENRKTYLSIIKGNLTKKVTEDTPGAVKREYETKSGDKAYKYELVFDAVSGFVKDISFNDSDFGEQFSLLLEDDGELYQIQTPTEGRYFQDFAKKISNIFLDMEIRIAPYDFEDKEGRKRSGLSITQDGDKIQNSFWDGKKVVNGFPEPENGGKNFTNDDWKIHFIKVKKFLKKHVTDVWGSRSQASEPVAEAANASPKQAVKAPAELIPEDDF